MTNVQNFDEFRLNETIKPEFETLREIVDNYYTLSLNGKPDEIGEILLKFAEFYGESPENIISLGRWTANRLPGIMITSEFETIQDSFESFNTPDKDELEWDQKNNGYSHVYGTVPYKGIEVGVVNSSSGPFYYMKKADLDKI